METQLPNCEKARVEDAKLYKYLLNPNHPDGKGKARFYALIGYTATNGEQLRDKLRLLACSGIVTKKLPNPEGDKYIVVASIDAPNGKMYELLTVWAIESRRGKAPDYEPRLITAYPNK